MSHSRPTIGVLGPLLVRGADGEALLRPAQRRLLAILLLEPASPLSWDSVTDRMWTESPPRTARTALHVHLSSLRKAVPGLLQTGGAGIRIDLASWDHDRATFEELRERCQSLVAGGATEEAIEAATRALALWRGAPFPELGDDEFATRIVRRLVEQRWDLEELRADLLLSAGRNEEALEALRRLTGEQPLRERAWELLMLGLGRSGRKAEALSAYQELRRILGEELGVEPDPTIAELEQRIRFERPLPGEEEPALPTNLPAPATSFVGREDDLATISAMLKPGSGTTVLGGPGIGKTRLVIEAGHRALPDFPDGVWFIPLAGLRTSQDLIGAIAGALGLRTNLAGAHELSARVTGRAALLILDNAEHLVGSVRALVSELLRGVTPSAVLVSSRRPVGFDGEVAWRATPLSQPDRKALSGSEHPLSAASVRLFVDRAREADRTFRLTPENGPMVADIARRTAGIPLALELAASWVPALGLAEIRDMLPSGRGSPRHERGARGRHWSLHTALQWSTALLSEEDVDLFHAAAVFRGTFALEDAVAVLRPDADRRSVAAGIARLVDASLLVSERQPDGAVRYRTLIPIREFAWERLREAADLQNLRQRFATHYLAKAIGGEQDPFHEVVDLAAVEDDLDNVREAFEIGLASGLANTVAVASTRLEQYFLNRYLVVEQRARAERLLPKVTDPLVRANLLRSLASACMVLGDLDESERSFANAILAFEEIGNTTALARCLVSYAGLHSHRGSWDAGIEAAGRARELLGENGTTAGLAVATYYLGENLALSGRLAEGIEELMRASRLYERIGDAGRASHALSTAVDAAVPGGDEASARACAGRALRLARASQSDYRLVRALAASAAFEGRWGDTRRARDQLLEVHRLMGPHESERVSEFLFPAAFLIHRSGEWELLIDLISAAEDAWSRLQEGYPVPWSLALAAMKMESRDQHGSSARGRPVGDTTLVETAVLDWLATLPAASEPLGAVSRP